MQELEATMTDLAIVRQMIYSRLDHAVDKGEVMGEKGIVSSETPYSVQTVWCQGISQ